VGPQGPAGPSGLANVTKVTGTAASITNGNVGDNIVSTAQCTNGAVLLAGGHQLTQGTTAMASVTSSVPAVVGANGTWSITATVAVKANQTISVQAYALCARP
jgi:hypothetical protein